MEPQVNRAHNRTSGDIRKFLDPSTLTLTYTCAPEDVETVKAGLAEMGFAEMDGSGQIGPGSGFGVNHTHCGYVFARFNMWNMVEEYAIVNEVPGLTCLSDELDKARARIRELEAEIADIRKEQDWDIDDEDEEEESIEHKTYTCSVCGMALMARGGELDMADRQLVFIDDWAYCPQCAREEVQDRAERDAKARIDP